ncbi:MAG: hypothetical protein AB7E46_12235 [Desulfovibrio sp.]|jgi:hypothetical protein
MKIIFKTTATLLNLIRADLGRPHAFAHERVGFIAAGLTAAAADVLVLAHEYRPVEDGDYLLDRSVGAMMGPEAIRKVLQWALRSRVALFHVHSHGGHGIPWFSGVDLRENAKFVPDFFKVAPQCAHGAIVLTADAANGQVWLDRRQPCRPIDAFSVTGVPLKKWRTT